MRQKRILLVEDNEELRHLYKEAFHHNNFEIFEASDGLLAIDVALLHIPDIILLDLMLPKQGGLGALKIFRTLPETKHIPIIILTALPNPDYKEQAKGRVQGYFLKTEITPKELVAKVRELID
ncbi:MAG: response regulator [Candidatus Berkelbacteria bacterium]|nr:response regulator [Candidatus Berkelbacteria bacterium]